MGQRDQRRAKCSADLTDITGDADVKHVNGDIIVVNAFSGGVNAGEPAACSIIVKAVVQCHTGALAAVPPVVVLTKLIEPTTE